MQDLDTISNISFHNNCPLAMSKKEHINKTFNKLDWSAQEISVIEFDTCIFKECDFSEATFKKCKFIDCSFVKCNLSIVKLAYSKFSDVSFSECKVIGVDWTKTIWPNINIGSPISFNQCIINDSSFIGLNLQEIVIRECKAHDVDFREGNFTGADFSYTDFSNSLFNKTNLTAVDFTEATNYTIDIYSNQIKSAKFSRYEAVCLLDSLDIELID